jgi:serine O-acetyltransferase
LKNFIMSFFNQLQEDIATIRAKDPAARSSWEVLTCYPGFHARTFHRMAHLLWRYELFWLARLVSHFSRWVTGIEIHPGAQLGRRVFMDHGMGIVIGETAIVGDDCTIYQGVTLGGTALTRGAKRHPTLEAGVIVGAGAQVLGSFTVGAGAKIGSNAVVVKPVPAGATAVGNPAHIVGSDRTSAVQFSAYGVNSADEDPIALALRQLLEQLEQNQNELIQLRAQLAQAGIDCGQVATQSTNVAQLQALLKPDASEN